jgi:hypothetical protein
MVWLTWLTNLLKIRKFFSRSENPFNILHKNYASYCVRPERPAQLPAGNYSEDALTKYTNDHIRAYNKFLLTQVFKAAAPENIHKLLSHMDQTHLTVNDAYQTFFTKLRVENDKRQSPLNTIHAVESSPQQNMQNQEQEQRQQSRSQPVGFNNHGN